MECDSTSIPSLCTTVRYFNNDNDALMLFALVLYSKSNRYNHTGIGQLRSTANVQHENNLQLLEVKEV
jgi:hypothetical protein